MRIFGLDPGPTVSGWAILDAGRVVDSGVDDNNDLRVWVEHGQRAQTLAIEVFEARGMPIGNDSVRTMLWTGRFIEAFPGKVIEVQRRAVKSFLCGDMKAGDPHIRQALIDLIGPQGTKKAPGATYGVKSHAWAALGVACTVAQHLRPAVEIAA